MTSLPSHRFCGERGLVAYQLADMQARVHDTPAGRDMSLARSIHDANAMRRVYMWSVQEVLWAAVLVAFRTPSA